MIESSGEFIQLRDNNDPRATWDYASSSVWIDVIQKFPEYKQWVLQNKKVPIDIISDLANDPDPQIRFFVAQKRKCPENVLILLSKDIDASVRERVAFNPKATKEILEVLKNDLDPQVAAVACYRLSENKCV